MPFLLTRELSRSDSRPSRIESSLSVVRARIVEGIQSSVVAEIEAAINELTRRAGIFAAVLHLGVRACDVQWHRRRGVRGRRPRRDGHLTAETAPPVHLMDTIGHATTEVDGGCSN